MLVYSKTIQSFLVKIKAKTHFIMKNEMGLDVRKSRFVWRGFLYPLHFVVFEDPKNLGYFHSGSYQIGLHKKLMYLAKDDVIENILRHELAHFYTFLLHGERFHEQLPHGEEFKSTCKNFRWGEDVSRAYSILEEENLASPSNPEFEKIKSKIEKLMALSQSENPHEAEAATIRANSYLIKYNLKNLNCSEDELSETVVLSAYRAKRLNATINGLYDILQYFHVQPVLNRNREGVSIDVVGSRLNVEIADYMAKHIALEFERLWVIARKKNQFKGLKKKNSYLLGLAQGLSEKLRLERQGLQSSPQGKDLMVLENQLKERVRLAFPRLSRQQSSSATLDQAAMAKGKNDGRNIKLRPGVSQGNKGKLLESS